MRFKKHAIHVAAVATMVGGLVTVAGTGVAGAATVAPSPASCALYIQGRVDPASGNLPPEMLPLKWTGQDYTVAGEVTAGDGSKVVADLQNGGDAATRFKASLTLNQTPVLTQLGGTLTKNTTTIKIQMKNDKSVASGGSGLSGMPTVQVFENGLLNAIPTKINAVKATVTGLAAATSNVGASLGNVQPGTLNAPTFTSSTQKLQLNIARNVTGGTFDLSVSAGGSVIPLGTYAPGASTALIAGTINGTFGFVDGGNTTATVTQTQAITPASVTLGPPITFIPGADRVLQIDLTSNSSSLFYGRNLAYSVVGSALTPADSLVSNGAIWNNNQTAGVLSGATRKGDPGVSIISDLGNNPIPFPSPGNGGPGSNPIYTANWVFANGGTGGIQGTATLPGLPDANGKNKAKANFVPDSQATFAMFSKGVIYGINPNPEGSIAALNLALSSGQPASLLTPSNETCSLSMLLALFCVSDPSQIPAAFAGFCTALADPDASSPSKPGSVTAATNLTDGVDVSWTAPTYAISGTDGAAALCGPTFTAQCDVLDRYEIRATKDGKTFSNWIPAGVGLSHNVTKAELNAAGAVGLVCGVVNANCIYQVRAQNQLAVAAASVFRPPNTASYIQVDGVTATGNAAKTK